MTRGLVKVLRDLWLTRGRVAFMVLALAAGLTSTGAVLSMRTVIQREMSREYAETLPASATLDLGAPLDDALLEEVRRQPGIASAERRATRQGRWRHPGGAWGRALIFAAEDLDEPQLARFDVEAGAAVPPSDGVLVERSAMQVLDATIGQPIELSVAGGPAVALHIAGVVHDPSLAPAATEQAGYFWVRPATLAALGTPGLEELRIRVADRPLDEAAVVAQATDLARWLQAREVSVHEVQVPPPGQHPHQRPSEAILLLFWIFSGLTVGLAGVLCASLLAVTMARQVREVAILKTLGATRADVRRLYLAMLGVVAVLALVASALPTAVLARLGTDAVTGLLNFDVASYAVPAWVIALQIGLGLLLPVLTAAPPILAASRVPVREALDDHGTSRSGAVPRLALGDRVTRLGLRSGLRTPRRFALTAGLLAVGGALFVSAASVADAWRALVDRVVEDRHHDVEVTLAEPARRDLLDAGEGWTVEAWATAPVTLADPSGLPVSHTYPDQGHGSFALVGAPDATALLDLRLREGRWLDPGDRDGVVLNQLAARLAGPRPVGRRVDLVVDGRRASWEVRGVVEEVAAPAQAYVSLDAFTARTGQPPNTLRIAGDGALATIGDRLRGRVSRIAPIELLFNAMGEHVVVLVRSLIGLSILMAIVGALALGATMSASVVERTREIGVLRALGARPGQLRWMILVEGWLVTAVSLPVALALAVPLSAGIGWWVGRLAFELPLPLDLSWTAAAGWSIGVAAIATLASLVPAIRAGRLTVREALGWV